MEIDVTIFAVQGSEGLLVLPGVVAGAWLDFTVYIASCLLAFFLLVATSFVTY